MVSETRLTTKSEINTTTDITMMIKSETVVRRVNQLRSEEQLDSCAAFMDSISDTLNANFGAIRKIYTTDGHRIRSLDELQDSETYVAAGLERFIRLKYI